MSTNAEASSELNLSQEASDSAYLHVTPNGGSSSPIISGAVRSTTGDGTCPTIFGKSEPPKTDVSVVIVSWNTRDILRGCLSSIYEETKNVSIEVFVVDNNSNDGSSDMVRAEFPRVKLIENERNRGFAAASNQGMQLASGRYTLLLNPDTIILEDAISRCVQYADHHPDVGVVGCQVLEDENRISNTGFSFPSPLNVFLALSGLSRVFPRSRLFGRPELGWWERDCEQDVDVVTGMFMLVRREAIAQVGIMDEFLLRLLRGG